MFPCRCSKQKLYKKNINPIKTYLNRLSGSQRKATVRRKCYSTKIIWKKRGV